MQLTNVKVCNIIIVVCATSVAFDYCSSRLHGFEVGSVAGKLAIANLAPYSVCITVICKCRLYT